MAARILCRNSLLICLWIVLNGPIAVAERVPKPEGFNLTDGLYLGGAALVVAILAVLLVRRSRGFRRPRK